MRLPGLRGYFNPGEARVNRVATGSWFQDQSEFVGEILKVCLFATGIKKAKAEG